MGRKEREREREIQVRKNYNVHYVKGVSGGGGERD